MASLVWEYESLDVPAARVPLRVPKHWFFTFTAFLRHFRRNSPALCLLSTHLGMMWPNIVFLRPGIRIKSTLDTIIGWKTVVYSAVRAGSSWFSFTSSFDSLATSFSCTWCSYCLKDVVWWPQHITLFLGSYRWETSGRRPGLDGPGRMVKSTCRGLLDRKLCILRKFGVSQKVYS